MLLLALLAFSSTPLSHEPRAPQNASQLDRPFFVSDMEHVVPREKLIWNSSETATPVLDQAATRLYVGTHDGKVRCKFRGKETWIFQANGAVLAAPIVEGETLLVPGGDGVLYALNRFTGKVRWQTDVHEELTTTPAIAGGRVFVMSSLQSISALDLNDGKPIWKFHRDPPGGFTIRGDARPQVAHGTVYAAFANGTVAALDPADGAARWTREVSGPSGDYLDVDSIDAPEADSRIYVASAKAGAVALDVSTGDVVWTTAIAGANHVLADGRRVIAGGRGAVVALDRLTGKQIWKVVLEKDQFPTQPVIINGLVLVSRDRGPLLGIDVQTGEARGAFDPGSGFSQAPLVLPGVAYIVSNGGALFSLGLLP
jgi:outer membrane protein assembly factor BamB